jgi:hypothetical protein
MADDETNQSKPGDLRSMLRSLISPVIEQVETRVSTQIDDEVSAKVDELLTSRMATIDRAIGDLDRHLLELTARLDRVERSLSEREEPEAVVASLDSGGDDDPDD